MNLEPRHLLYNAGGGIDPNLLFDVQHASGWQSRMNVGLTHPRAFLRAGDNGKRPPKDTAALLTKFLSHCRQCEISETNTQRHNLSVPIPPGAQCLQTEEYKNTAQHTAWLTPGVTFSTVSILYAQEAQVIPRTKNWLT